MTDVESSPGVLKFDVFLKGIGDGGDVRIIVTKKTMSVQPLWSTGEVAGQATIYKLAQCPE